MCTVDLITLFKDPDAALDYAIQHDMLYIHGQCDECDGNYELYTDVYKQNKCYLKCIKCGSKRSILNKSIFTRTKLKPNKVLHLLYCWAMQNSRNIAAHECGVSRVTRNFGIRQDLLFDNGK